MRWRALLVSVIVAEIAATVFVMLGHFAVAAMLYAWPAAFGCGYAFSDLQRLYRAWRMERRIPELLGQVPTVVALDSEHMVATIERENGDIASLALPEGFNPAEPYWRDWLMREVIPQELHAIYHEVAEGGDE